MESNDKVIVTPMSKNFFLNESRMISLNSTLNQLVQGKSKVLTPSKTNIQKNSCKIENLYRKIQFFNNFNKLFWNASRNRVFIRRNYLCPAKLIRK